MEPVPNTTKEAAPNAPLAGRDVPVCKKCKAPMGEVYELDVPILKDNRDTGKRDRHYGYICRGCHTVAWTLNGKEVEQTMPKELRNPADPKKPQILGTIPKQAHPWMQRMLGTTLKMFRAAQ